jgi:uncharacterized pyridoxal phosphate-containing UPF0001 family protein
MCIPPFESPEETRSYFRRIEIPFDELKQKNQENIDIRELSMACQVTTKFL